LLKCWGGFWGLVIHGGPKQAYTVESLRQSPDRQALRRQVERWQVERWQVERHGLQLHAARNCFGGMLGILVLERELAPTRGPEAVASGWCIHES